MSKRLTYASNLLKWRVGCFNIDATRVGGKNGRFCANIILSHTSDCEYLGVTEDTRSGGERTTTCHSGKEPKSGGEGTGGTMKETSSISKYSCSPDCPCRLMDEQANQGASRFFIQIESEPK